MDGQELARTVNERIYEIAVKYGDDVDIDYLCECGCRGSSGSPPMATSGTERCTRGTSDHRRLTRSSTLFDRLSPEGGRARRRGAVLARTAGSGYGGVLEPRPVEG